jgi:transposase-like protein
MTVCPKCGSSRVSEISLFWCIYWYRCLDCGYTWWEVNTVGCIACAASATIMLVGAWLTLSGVGKR